MMARACYENDLGNVDVAVVALPARARDRSAQPRRGRVARAPLPHAERYAELSGILQRKSEILEEPVDKKDALFQAAAIEEDVLEQAEAAIAVYQKVLEIDPDDLRAIDALIKQYLGLSRWSDLLAVYAQQGGSRRRPRREEAHLLPGRRRLRARARATCRPRSTRTAKILELDPDDIQALSRLDVLYEQAQNWNELLSVLTRESEMTADPNEATSFQYRIAELYEKHLDDVARAIELYREILAASTRPRADPRAPSKALKSGERDPLGAAAVLEPVYEAASDWPQLIRVHEVQVQHAADAFQKVELLHRIARLYEDALDNHAPRSTRTRARSRSTTATSRRSRTSSGSRWP